MRGVSRCSLPSNVFFLSHYFRIRNIWAGEKKTQEVERERERERERTIVTKTENED